MQCVILCAGKGTRMRPLTNTIPKPLIEVCGKPVLQHIVEVLPEEIDELILVVGYKQEQIRDFCGSEYLGKRITYCEQEDFSAGTGDALLCAAEKVVGKFLFMYGDDIHGADALKEAVMHDHAILGAYSDTPERFGVLEANDEGMLKAIPEKPENPTSNLVNIGGFVLDPIVFTYSAPVSESGEVYVNSLIEQYAAVHPVVIVQQETWLPIGYPEHIAAAEAVLCPHRV